MANIVPAGTVQSILPRLIVAGRQADQGFTGTRRGDLEGVIAQFALRIRVWVNADQIDCIANQGQLAAGVDHDQTMTDRRNQSSANFRQQLPGAFLDCGRFHGAGGGSGQAHGGGWCGHQVHEECATGRVMFNRVGDKTPLQNTQCLLMALLLVIRQIDQCQADGIILFQTGGQLLSGARRQRAQATPQPLAGVSHCLQATFLHGAPRRDWIVRGRIGSCTGRHPTQIAAAVANHLAAGVTFADCGGNHILGAAGLQNGLADSSILEAAHPVGCAARTHGHAALHLQRHLKIISAGLGVERQRHAQQQSGKHRQQRVRAHDVSSRLDSGRRGQIRITSQLRQPFLGASQLINGLSELVIPDILSG